MYTDEVGYIKVVSGNHNTEDPALKSWIVEVESRLTDAQKTAFTNLKHVIHGVSNIKVVNNRTFNVIVEASDPEVAGTEIVAPLIERFVSFLQRQTTQARETPLAVYSEPGNRDD